MQKSYIEINKINLSLGKQDHYCAAYGGLNFINANTYATQDFEFDIAVNIVSMCEMNKNTTSNYVKFIEKNISLGHKLLYSEAGEFADLAEPRNGLIAVAEVFRNRWLKYLDDNPDIHEKLLDINWTILLVNPILLK